MVYLSSVNNYNVNANRSFGKKADEKEKEQEKDAQLLYRETKESPISTALKIEGNKLKKAFTTYPQKGFEGSKNSNFYEFLTMGTVPYLVGSAMMIGVFNAASRFFSTPDATSASKLGKKMALGVVFYGLAKNISKKFIEEPLNIKYGIDVNLPYKAKIHELPEERNTKNLVQKNPEQIKEENLNNDNNHKDEDDKLIAYEYHKAYDSVDFPYWNLFYDNEDFGPEHDSYFKNVGKKMGISDDDLEYSDQKVKPLIKEKLIQTKVFSTLSSYLWAAVGVGLAVQKPFEKMLFNPIQRFKDWKNGYDHPFIVKDFAKNLSKSFKELVGSDKTGTMEYIVNKCKNIPMNPVNKPQPKHIAGRALLGAAIGTTLLGNFVTLTDFNKDKGRNPNASTSIIDDAKEKVVC